MRRALLLTVVLVAAVALPSATPAERGKLTVRSVATPRSAIPGSPVNLTARIGHTAEMMSATVPCFLSRDDRFDRHDTRLAGDVRLSRRVRGHVIWVSASPRVPVRQPPGTYRLIACVRHSCHTSDAPLALTTTPIGTRKNVTAAVAAHRAIRAPGGCQVQVLPGRHFFGMRPTDCLLPLIEIVRVRPITRS